METVMSRLRINAGLSRAEASRQLGIDQSALWRWESGKREPPALQVRALARLYGVSVDTVIDAVEVVQKAGAGDDD